MQKLKPGTGLQELHKAYLELFKLANNGKLTVCGVNTGSKEIHLKMETFVKTVNTYKVRVFDKDDSKYSHKFYCDYKRVRIFCIGSKEEMDRLRGEI